MSLFAGWHVLIEWTPGLGKTKTVKTLAKILGYEFKRISFTPDLLPSDLTGSEIYRPQKWVFEVRKWPIFTEILLADEINRTPPKVQSALLEAMEEHQVTIGEKSLALPSPFFVIATENPLEHEGTYPLPEAQLDRFLMKIVIEYPSATEEKKIFTQELTAIEKKTESSPVQSSELLEMQQYIWENIRVDEKILDYISDILELTRKRKTENIKNPSLKDNTLDSQLSYGASTRAGIALIRTSRVLALLEWRDFVLPEDVKSLAHEILRHRIGLSYESMSDWITTDLVISEILESVKIP